MKKNWRILFHVFLLITLGLLAYRPALEASFHLDDSPSIRDNLALRSLSPAKIFAFWPTRFLSYLSLAINFHFSGLNPRPYHAVNIVIHILNALLVYWLIRLLLFPEKDRKTGSRTPGAGGTVAREGFIPLAGALFFLLHPVQTQAVTYVVQRATSLAAGFYLLSVALYCRARVARRGGTGRVLLFQGSLGAAAAAMLSKEFAVTLPLILVLLEVLSRTREKPFPWKRLLPFFLTLLIVPALFLTHRDNLYYGDSPDIPFPRYFSTQERVFGTYLRLVLLPIRQRVEYDYPWQPSPLSFPATLGGAVWGAWIMAAWRARRGSWPTALGLLWFAATLLPESLKPITDAAVEHRLYLPLAGISLTLSSALAAWPERKRMAGIIPMLILALLGYLCFSRNRAWKNPVTLWEDNVRKAPGKSRLRGNLGKAYLDAGRYARAAEEFERMIELDPAAAGAYNNLAVIHIDHNRDDEKARGYILKALEIFPEYPSAYLNLGVIEMNNMRLLPAIRYFEKVLELEPANRLARYNIAASYFNLANRLRREAEGFQAARNQAKAKEKFREAAGCFSRAEEYASSGSSIWPEDPAFPQLMGLICKTLARPKEAKDYFQKARILKTGRGN